MPDTPSPARPQQIVLHPYQALQVTEKVLNDLIEWWNTKGPRYMRHGNIFHLAAARHLVQEQFFRLKDHGGNPEWCLPPHNQMTRLVHEQQLEKLRQEAAEGKMPPAGTRLDGVFTGR